MATLQYYYAKNNGIELVIFNKYTIDKNGVILNKKSGKILGTRKNNGGYNVASVQDAYGGRRGILIGRALASSYLSSPPTPNHTADHIDRDRDNDIRDNIRWATKKEQINNQYRKGVQKTALIIVKDGLEKTANEWLLYFKDQKNSNGRDYTVTMFNRYAQKKQHGFSYKEYPNLSGEVWKEIADSKSTYGRWEISNMSRVKYITKYAENVLSGERLGLDNGYPVININGRSLPCHILSFMTFFPDKWENKKPAEMILHENDDKLDFRPNKLRIGTRNENMTDAHINGCHDGKESARIKCVSYVNGVFEKKHDSQLDAVRYLKSIGFEKAASVNISTALRRTHRVAYGRTWKISA
jgi:hypothetical protein